MAHDPEGAQTRSLAAVDELGKSNPLALVNSMNNNNEENRVDGLVTAKWTLSPELSLNTSLAVNYYNIKEQQYRTRSDKRRGGKECVSPLKSRRSLYI